MKTVQIFGNNTERTKAAIADLKTIIGKSELVLVEDTALESILPDLAIAVGGDGSFLNMLHQLNFNANTLYAGVHTGHLGFLQEVDVNEMGKFIDSIVNNKYRYETVSVEDVTVYAKSVVPIEGNTNEYPLCSFKALNEISVKERNSKTVHLDILIDGKQLEKLSGNEVLVSTSTGSTAYNMSAGGSLIYPTINMLQITPVAPLNSKSYRSLRNSVIVPEHMVVTIVPEERYSDSLLVVVDGENHMIDSVSKIEVTAAKEGAKVVRFGEYDFWERINEKFL